MSYAFLEFSWLALKTHNQSQIKHVQVFTYTDPSNKTQPNSMRSMSSRGGQVEWQKGRHFMVPFLSRGTHSTTCTTITMAIKTTCINAMKRPNVNNSFKKTNLPNIVHLERVNRLL